MKKQQFILATALCAALSATAQATTIEELQKQVDTLNSQVKAISESGKKPTAPSGGIFKQVWEKTTFGGYGELDYIFKRENGNGKGSNTFDPHRVVLNVNSELADWIAFGAELEWEHGGVKDQVSDEGELSGEVAVEQAFLDFKLAPSFNAKAGVMLVPLGAINLYHEPTEFNSSERPQLDQILIPSTWSEMGVAIHGAAGSIANYQLMVLNGLDGTKFSAAKGIREGRQNLNADNNRNKAVAGRLELRPLPGLNTNGSFYAGNSAKNGTAYTTIAAFDGSYRAGDFALSGEYVFIYQDNPAALGVSDISRTMSGYWVEGAYHVMPEKLKNGNLAEADALVFVRYSEMDTQEGGIADPTKASGRYDRNYTNLGAVFKPVPSVAIKADYQFYNDKRTTGETALDNDKFQITLGFVF